MKYVFYGEDSYSISEAVSKLKASAGTADVRDVNITVFDGPSLTMDRLAATCDTIPFLSEKRLVIVEGLISSFETSSSSRGQSRKTGDSQKKPGQWERLPEYLKRVPETTDLVFVEGVLKATNPLWKRIKPVVQDKQFPPLKGKQLREWVQARIVELDVRIEPGALGDLIATVGSDLRTMSSEIEKLALYRHGDTIRKADVAEMVSYVKEVEIFGVVDCIVEGRVGEAVKNTHLLLASDTVSHLMNMLGRQVRLLLLLKDMRAHKVTRTEIGTRLKLQGYALEKLLEQEPKFTTEGLIQIHSRLLEADLHIKTGVMSEGVVIDLLIADLASLSSKSARK